MLFCQIGQRYQVSGAKATTRVQPTLIRHTFDTCRMEKCMENEARCWFR